MTVQKRFNPQEAAEYAFRKRYCRTKVWIALKNGQTKTFFADDCNATWLQQACGHIALVEFSYEKGMEYVLRKEQFFKGQYDVLQVYRRELSIEWPKDPVITFSANGGKKVLADDLPPNIRCAVTRKPGSNFIGYDIELKPVKASIQRPVPTVEAIAPATPPTLSDNVNAAIIKTASDRISARWNVSR